MKFHNRRYNIQGNEDLKQQRKKCIKSINGSLKILESKAQQHAKLNKKFSRELLSEKDYKNDTVSKNDSNSLMLDMIMDNVRQLKEQLYAFQGVKDSEEYKFLEEKFTQKLLILDSIDSKENMNIMKKHKESIRTVNVCMRV